MTLVIGQDVADYLGRGDETDLVALAELHLGHVTNYVREYVRGQGFDDATGEPNDSLASVIVAATARVVTNPALTRSESIGGYSVTYGAFLGYTLAELGVLHNYRVKLA